MWRLARGLTLLLIFSLPVLSQERYLVEKFPSRNVGERTVRIYLPASYLTNTGANYPVLYLHDGQNVFSFAGTNVAFGWGSWELDRTADRLAAERKMQEIIMVAVDNSQARLAEYGGGVHHNGTNGLTPYEKYEDFLLKELKPAIDSRFRTRSKAADTAVMGSSMGGLCSIVLTWKHPEVFGGAASLSGAFMMNTNFLNSVLHTYQGPLKDLRLYLDCGSVDFMGGDDGRALTTQVAGELRRIGYQDCPPESLGKNSFQRKPAVMLFVDEKPLAPGELEKTGLRRDKWKEAGTSQHNEFYWRIRVWRAFEFLFPPLTP